MPARSEDDPPSPESSPRRQSGSLPSQRQRLRVVAVGRRSPAYATRTRAVTNRDPGAGGSVTVAARACLGARDRAAGGSQPDCCGACAGTAFGAGNHHPVAHDAGQGTSQRGAGLPGTVRDGGVGGSRPAVAKVRLPAQTAIRHVKRVPPHLRHLFWNTAPAQLEVATSAPYIARRLIQADDPDGLAWGAASLPASAWEHAAATRGLDPAHRALAHNLARHEHVAG